MGAGTDADAHASTEATVMLCLTRHLNQRVQIGDDVFVTVVLIKNGQSPTVKLGFEAPKHMRIVREEAKRKAPKDAPNHAPPRTTHQN